MKEGYRFVDVAVLFPTAGLSFLARDNMTRSSRP